MLVRFWGVRGSIACPGEAYNRYGGNTSCIEIRVNDRAVILDAGTGLRELGRHLSGKVEADILLTHTHMDHIGGVPFFGPLFGPSNHIRLWAGHLLPKRSLQSVLEAFMSDPVFPVPPSIFDAKVEFNDFHAGETLVLNDQITAKTAPLQHPNGATAYRIEAGGKSVVYCTDTEHTPGVLDQNVLDICADADILIYDSTYTDEEYPKHVGWGHSTWQEGLRIAEAAGVGRLGIFHHDPSHDDDFMDAVAAEAAKLRPGTFVAREGQVIEL